MASCSSKRRRREAEKLYSTGPSSFYRILLPESEFQTHIEIPRKFARYCFGAKPILPVKATLRAPNGASRSATMTRRGDDLFLSDDGWEEFVKACTLQAYNILIFKYDGISIFDVQILDEKYLSKKVLNIHKETLQARKEVGKKTDVSSTANTQETTHIHTLESSCDSYGSFKKPLPRSNHGTNYAYKLKKETAVEMAHEYMARKRMTDSSFAQILRFTHVSKRFTMNFPKAWFGKYLPQKRQNVYLQLGNQRWILDLIYCPSRGNGRCVGGGWKLFVEANHLEEFDVCVLSFLNRNDDVAIVDVSIFQAEPTMVTPLNQASDTICDLAPHKETDTSSDLTPYEAKYMSFDPPPFRATEMSSSSFIYHFERLWRSFPKDKLVQSTYLEWFHFERYQLGKTDVLPSIKQKNIFSRNYVFVPILRWKHWNLLILCHFDESFNSKNKKPCMLLLDSLHMAGPRRLEKDIREFVMDIYKDEGIADPRVSQIPLLVPKVPQQKGDECGYFSLYFIKKFMETAPEDGDMSFIDENWFTRDEFEAFCIALNKGAPQEMPSTRRIMQRRCKRPFPSKGDDDEIIIIE